MCVTVDIRKNKNSWFSIVDVAAGFKFLFGSFTLMSNDDVQVLIPNSLSEGLKESKNLVDFSSAVTELLIALGVTDWYCLVPGAPVLDRESLKPLFGQLSQDYIESLKRNRVQDAEIVAEGINVESIFQSELIEFIRYSPCVNSKLKHYLELTSVRNDLGYFDFYYFRLSPKMYSAIIGITSRYKNHDDFRGWINENKLQISETRKLIFSSANDILPGLFDLDPAHNDPYFQTRHRYPLEGPLKDSVFEKAHVRRGLGV